MRLNKELRADIVVNAYEASDIPAAKKALTARSVALSEAVRLAGMAPGLDDTLKAAEAEIKLILKKRGVPDSQAPSVIFSRSNYVGAYFGAEGYTSLSLNGDMTYSRRTIVDADYKMDARKFTGSKAVRYDDRHPFTIEYDAIKSDANDLLDREKILRETVAATVAKFNTVEKLIELWPEAKALIPKHVEKANAPMPIAIQVADLNAMIGLPK